MTPRAASFPLVTLLLGTLAVLGPVAAANAQQPDLKTAKADFVPGDKTLFYDDFTDMAEDAPPPHWKVRGASVVLKTAPGVRQLTSTGRGNIIPTLKGLPKNFTLEAVLKFDTEGDLRSKWFFLGKGDTELMQLWLQARGSGRPLFVRVTDAKETLGEKETTSLDLANPISVSLWVQDGRLRVYVNGERVVDANQVELPPITSVTVESESGERTVGYRFVRFAESAPDFSQVISASGRYVTYGILFDTDSDRLKPESAAVLKMVARGLEANPALKLLIEGHTDGTGDAAHNLDLSTRRAEAVKAVLASQFGVDAARLTTAGLGSTKPAGPNDTSQGRAQNRRVEFVRQ
jgi:outer membrane protein OmpA-like peptidoglycan-associated protein